VNMFRPMNNIMIISNFLSVTISKTIACGRHWNGKRSQPKINTEIKREIIRKGKNIKRNQSLDTDKTHWREERKGIEEFCISTSG